MSIGDPYHIVLDIVIVDFAVAWDTVVDDNIRYLIHLGLGVLQ